MQHAIVIVDHNKRIDCIKLLPSQEDSLQHLFATDVLLLSAGFFQPAVTRAICGLGVPIPNKPTAHDWHRVFLSQGESLHCARTAR